MPAVKKIIASIVIWSISISINLLAVIGLLIARLIKGKDFFHVKERTTPPPLLIDPKWGTHKYMSLKSGIKLHYVESGDQQKPLIVCVHGFPECWFSWRHQLQTLSQHYWVVAVDMRGYGDSDKPSKKSDYARTLIVEDLRQFFIGLGKDKCTLVAHDWGGVLAWQLVMQYPELFSTHVSLNAPHPKSFMQVLDSSWTQKCKYWYMYLFQCPWIPELVLSIQDLKAFDDMFKGIKDSEEESYSEVLEVFKYYFSQKGGFTYPLNYYRNVDLTALREEYPKVAVPTLIIWGVANVGLTKEIATKAVTECQSGELKFIEGASHFVQQDNPKEVNQYILDFLSTQLRN